MLKHEFNGHLYIGTKVTSLRGVDYQEFRCANPRRPHTLYATRQPDGTYEELQDPKIAEALYLANRGPTFTDEGPVIYVTGSDGKTYTPEQVAKINAQLAADRHEMIKAYVDHRAKKWGKYLGVNKDNVNEFKAVAFARLDKIINEFQFDPNLKAAGTYYPASNNIKFGPYGLHNKSTHLHEIDHAWHDFYKDQKRLGVQEYSPDKKYYSNLALMEGITCYATGGGYPNELELTNLISAITGEDALIQGQQNGVGIIESRYEAIMGKDTFGELMVVMDENCRNYLNLDFTERELPFEDLRSKEAWFKVGEAHKENLDKFFSDLNKAIDKAQTPEEAKAIAQKIKSLRKVHAKHNMSKDVEQRIKKAAKHFKQTTREKFGKSFNTHTFGSAIGDKIVNVLSAPIIAPLALATKASEYIQNKRTPSIAQVQMRMMEKEMIQLMAIQNKTPEDKDRIAALTLNYETLKLQAEFAKNPMKEGVNYGFGGSFLRTNQITGEEVTIRIGDYVQDAKNTKFYHQPYKGKNPEEAAEILNNIAVREYMDAKYLEPADRGVTWEEAAYEVTARKVELAGYQQNARDEFAKAKAASDNELTPLIHNLNGHEYEKHALETQHKLEKSELLMKYMSKEITPSEYAKQKKEKELKFNLEHSRKEAKALQAYIELSEAKIEHHMATNPQDEITLKVINKQKLFAENKLDAIIESRKTAREAFDGFKEEQTQIAANPAAPKERKSLLNTLRNQATAKANAVQEMLGINSKNPTR